MELKYNLKNNLYFESNSKYFMELVQLIEMNHFSWKNILCKKYSKKYKKSYQYLFYWILENTSILNKDNYTFSTRCYWILQGYIFFPFCYQCCQPIYRNVVSIYEGYTQGKHNLDVLYCCNTCAQNSNIVKKYIKNTCIVNLGVDSPFKSKNIQEKIRQSMQTNYGVDYPLQSNFLLQKSRNTLFQHTGSYFPMGTIESKEKAKNTWLHNFGYDNPLKCREIRLKGKHKYIFNNEKFDSKEELIFYIWNIDHGNKCICQPDAFFEYIYDNKIYKYIPDFLINGQYYEIKGLHFFEDHDPNKRMISPYNPSRKSSKSKSWFDDKNEAKHQCMILNKVIIITELSSEYKYAKDYFESKYTKSFIEQCKVK